MLLSRFSGQEALLLQNSVVKGTNDADHKGVKATALQTRGQTNNSCLVEGSKALTWRRQSPTSTDCEGERDCRPFGGEHGAEFLRQKLAKD